MKKTYLCLVTITILITFIACDENQFYPDTCSVKEPIKDLQWLRDTVQTIQVTGYAEYNYISRAEYKGKVVFIFRDCHPLWNSIFPVYNCDGEIIGNIAPQSIDPNYIENDKIIWKSDDSLCYN